MTRLRVLASRVMGWFSGDRRDVRLDEEIRSHLDLAAAEHGRRGLSAEEALKAARRDFGGVAQIKESHRDQRGLPFLDVLAQDLRYGLRTFRRSPAFAASVVLSLALGIGPNTAIFSLLDAVFFRSLPVAHPERLVTVRPQLSGGAGILSHPVFEELQSQQQVCEGLLATSGPQPLTIQWDGSAVTARVMSTQVSSNYFSLIGAPVPIGRGFTPADERPGAPRVAVISNDLWARQFAGNPSVLGRRIDVSGSPAVIVGVAPRAFRGEVPGLASDVWLLMSQFRTAEDLRNRAGSSFQVMGRLRPGVTLEDAQTSLTFVYRQSLTVERRQESVTAVNPAVRLSEARLQLDPGGRGLLLLQKQFAQPLLVLMAIVALVLLVACANVANLLLARSVARQNEIGVRLALGSSRRRLIRQLLTESLLLACGGGAAGLLLAYISGGVLTTLLAGGLLPLTLDLTPDLRVLLFTAATSMATGLVFGFVPALQATRGRLGSDGGARGGTPQRQRLAKMLVGAQIALSLVLLVAAGLLVTSVRNLHDVDPGFDREGVLLMEVHSDHPVTASALTVLSDGLRTRMRALPGVVGVSYSWLPLFDPFTDMSAPLSIDGYAPRAAEAIVARYNAVSDGYFEAVGMKLLAGRGFTSDDREASRRVIVVNERFVKQYFAGQTPVGKIVSIAVGPKSGWQPREIVGVVGDAKYNDLRREVRPLFYAPITQLVRPVQSIEVRTKGAANLVALEPSLRHVLADVAPQFVVDEVRTVAQQVDRPLATERLIATLSASFGLLALVLAAVGLYGLLSYAVARRTAEIGLRMALGASRSRLLWLVLRECVALVTAGTACGLALAIAATRAVSRFLYGLTATDPWTITAVSLALIAVAVVAAYVPARRASRVDPVIALQKLVRSTNALVRRRARRTWRPHGFK